jgi:DNA-binding NarL/FixJ family response regulator
MSTAAASAPTPKVVLLIDRKAFTRECIAKCLMAMCAELTVIDFGTVQECLGAHPQPESPSLILYNAHGSALGDPGIAEDLGRLRDDLEPHPVVVLSDLDRMDAIQEAFQLGARGFIPTTSTTLDVAVEVIRLVRVGGTFMPMTSNAANAGTDRSDPAGILESQFTPRQIAVLNQLRQGKANKIIAHQLQMSESTVKVHVRNIMKKMKATNRTEVAFRAQALRMSF